MSPVAAAVPLRVVKRRPVTVVARRSAPPRITFRTATEDDAAAIHAFIADHLVEGRLLPRSIDEVRAHAARFAIALHGDRVVGCADLAPLGRSVAEVRSLVVAGDMRSHGIGRRLLDALTARASIAGFDKLCAFTHSPRYFLQFGFSLVPHAWIPEKIDTDCRTCAQFRQCGQYAVMLPLVRSRSARVPLASLHG